MNNAIGLGLLLYCAVFCGYSLGVKEFIPEPRFYLQSLVSGLGGLSVLIYNNFSMCSRAWLRIKEWYNSINPNNPLKDKRMKDHEVMAYLKTKMKNMKSERGMELLIELNTIIFAYDEDKNNEGEQ